jgi:hypothetical protein
MYHVMNIRTGEFWPDCEEGGPMYFVTAAEAQTAEVNLNSCIHMWAYYPSTAHLRQDSPVRVQGLDTPQVSGRDKWQIRPAASAANENWRDRENSYFANKIYTPVPWADHPAWQELLKTEPHASHFLHISTQDETYVSFTPDEEYGKFDRQIKMTPMRYFKKYCPFVEQSTKDEWMKKWIVTNNNQTILFAWRRDEIHRVYKHGPPSCMSHDKSRFWGDDSPLPHPVEAYAGGDLAVAYLRRNIKGITARAVVWPDMRIMGPKVYGSDSHLLRMMLEDEGYETSKEGFHGARLLKIYYPKENCYILPYIDRGKVLLTAEGEIHFDKEGVDASITNGVIALHPPYKSDKSGNTYYQHKTPKITVWLGKERKETWARSELVEAHIYQCCMTGSYFDPSYLAPVQVLANSNLLNVNSETAKQLKDRCEYYQVPTNERVVPIITGYSADGKPISEPWSVTAASSHSFAYRQTRYAEWLASNLRPLTPFIAEHIYVEGLEPYQITEEINRKNARDLMRVSKKDRATGKYSIEYPFEVKKAQEKKVQEGKTPVVAQKKIGSGAWTPAFPQGEASEADDDDDDDDHDFEPPPIKKKGNRVGNRGVRNPVWMGLDDWYVPVVVTMPAYVGGNPAPIPVPAPPVGLAEYPAAVADEADRVNVALQQMVGQPNDLVSLRRIIERGVNAAVQMIDNPEPDDDPFDRYFPPEDE